MNIDKKTLDAMVNRFLGWKLPQTFGPDAGISFNPTPLQKSGVHPWPTGTNLFTADEARAMLEHVLGMSAVPEFFCNKCGYFGPEALMHQRPNGTGECGYLAAPMKTAPGVMGTFNDQGEQP